MRKISECFYTNLCWLCEVYFDYFDLCRTDQKREQQGIPAGRASSKERGDWRESVWLVYNEGRKHLTVTQHVRDWNRQMIMGLGEGKQKDAVS